MGSRFSCGVVQGMATTESKHSSDFSIMVAMPLLPPTAIIGVRLPMPASPITAGPYEAVIPGALNPDWFGDVRSVVV